MQALQRDQVAPPALPEELVHVPALGGAVRVRGMDMRQLLAFRAAQRRATLPQGDETEADAAERASGELLPLMLAACVLAADGLPVYTAEQWATFGGGNAAQVYELWAVAVRLCGGDAAAEKKA